jgi:DNA-binding CsgD family transcriptional regulator
MQRGRKRIVAGGYVVCSSSGGSELTEAVALVGREFELARVDAFLAEVSSESSRGLLIQGEPGTGKTALWLQGLSDARSRGFRTLVARPVEVETALSFSVLVDLFEPVLEKALPRLPEPQRQALEIALLLRPADAALDGRALATAVLNALRVLSQASPLIVAVDDVQWLDSSSHAVLAFAARRLSVEHVGFMLTRRTNEDGAILELETALGGRLERLSPAPLSMGSLNRLLQMHFGRTFSRPLVRRLREVSGGNPYFTLELAQALEQHGATRDSIRELPLTATLREVVHDRLASLPVAERRLLMGVAALSHPSFALLAAAFGRNLDASALKRSFATRVVELDGERIRFTHPLLRSVVYADATSETRRTVHRRLAGVVGDPEESAQHLALATDQPDARVAARLDEAATIVRARGAPARAAELMTRAVELTPPGDTQIPVRRLAAADCWTDAGDAARAVPLLEAAIADSASGTETAEALARLGWIRCRSAGYRDGRALFEQAATQPTNDPVVRISIAKGLGWADEMLGDLGGAENHARDAVTLAEQIDDDAVVAESLADLGFIQLLRGRPEFADSMRRALAVDASHAEQGAIGRARWLAVRTHWFNAVVLGWTDQLDAARAALLELRAQADAVGHEHVLPDILNWLGRVECFADRWRDGLSYAQEADAAAVQADLAVERPYVLATIGLAHAHLGEVDPARAALSEGLAVAQRLEVVPGRLELLAAKGFLELSLGQPDDAHQTLARLADHASAAGFALPATLRFHPDLVEAAIQVGDLDGARRCASQLTVCAKNFGTPWGCAIDARCEGLIAAAEGDLEGALASLEHALAEHERLPSHFERGRTLLQQGIVLRRLKQKRAARDAITTALETFTKLGARLWAERAEREQARISGSRPTRTSRLTETESRVAALVAAGQANKQVAAELHVTVRTVESNLTSIYRKLGIRSRAQLASTLHSPR